MLDTGCLGCGASDDCYVQHENTARLYLKGGKARIEWPEWDAGYYAGDGSIETQSIEFDQSLLNMTPHELGEWLEERSRERDRIIMDRRALEQARIEQQERSLLARLEQKYKEMK
jgi:hypothetical protein